MVRCSQTFGHIVKLCWTGCSMCLEPYCTKLHAIIAGEVFSEHSNLSALLVRQLKEVLGFTSFSTTSSAYDSYRRHEFPHISLYCKGVMLFCGYYKYSCSKYKFTFENGRIFRNMLVMFALNAVVNSHSRGV